MEREYEFTLALSGITELSDSVMDAFFEAGCDDATFSRRSGRVYATFSRRLDSIVNAVLSAICDIRLAGVGVDVLRVDYCNLVTQAEIARRIGRSRQMVNQYVRGDRGPGDFPPPVCELCEGQVLWYWCEVATWLYENSMITEDVLIEADAFDAINAYLETSRIQKQSPQLANEISQKVGIPTSSVSQ